MINWVKIQRWPLYLSHPEILDMSYPEYVEWYKANIWHAKPGWKVEREKKLAQKAQRPVKTAEEIKERRLIIARGLATLALKIIKGLIILVVLTVMVIFSIGKDQNSSRRYR